MDSISTETSMRSTPSAVNVANTRDPSIDALRGFAVFSMFGANLAPYTLSAPHPLWFRIWASVAAPIFVFLAGYTVGARAASRSIWKYVKRGTALLIVAALIDLLCWGVTPFTTFDVLYTIGLGVPACARLVRMNAPWQLGVAAVPIIATPLLQEVVGYGSESPSWFLDVVQALLVDGWFPVCPWLGISLCGAIVGRARTTAPREAQPKLVWAGALTLLAGVVVHALTTPDAPTRGGYVELFYPPSLGYVLIGIGFILLTLAALRHRGTGPISRLLAIYGRTALLMYVAHTFIIAFVFKRYLQPDGFALFLAVYALLAGLLWVVASWVRMCFPNPRSFWTRLLLGS